MPTTSQFLIFAAGLAVASLGSALLGRLAPVIEGSSLSRLAAHLRRTAPTPDTASPAAAAETCLPAAYATEIISLDPLVIYVANLIAPAERAALVAAGTPLLQPSPVTGYGGDSSGGAAAAAAGEEAQSSQVRTSWSAPLPGTDRTVACVLARAEGFLGSVLAAGRDEMGAAQMVRYTAGQKFDAHHDWFARPRLLDADAESGRRRLYNRVATLFAVLECAGCTEGETWFPEVWPVAAVPRAEGHDGAGPDEKVSSREGGDDGRPWRVHERGGVAFRPIPGNAVFWVNLFPNGTGDTRTLHAGLPVGQGVKTAMNIWPRTFFGPDA